MDVLILNSHFSLLDFVLILAMGWGAHQAKNPQLTFKVILFCLPNPSGYASYKIKLSASLAN
jgi:hypothetical protein